MNCPNCSSPMQSRGVVRGKRKFKCQNCGRWEYRPVGEGYEPPTPKSHYSNDGQTIFVSYVSDHIPSTEEIAQQYKIDLNEWEVKKIETTDWQTARKDRQVNMTYTDGVANGTVIDSGEFTRVWNHRVNVTFVRRTEEIRARTVLHEMRTEAISFAPKYPKIKYPEHKDGLLYEIDLPDIHFGRLSWSGESGEDYDIKIAEQFALTALNGLLAHAKNYPISKILFPFGNDFFNVNNKLEMTVHGTPQQEDTRWSKTFKSGRMLATQMIEWCSQIAPVDVMIVAGNHDEERMFYLGEALEGRFYNNPNVYINNEAIKRKYYAYGQVLLGFTHGYYEKPQKLPLVMAIEAPHLWAKAKFREWHLGDKHHKKEFEYKTDESTGVVVRILRALAVHDTWTFDKGYVGALKAAESFLWHPDNGLVAQFTSLPDPST